MRLALIGLAAGFFSAIFGVGGGVVIVPLLILLAGLDPHPATGTSLAAIGLIALAGTVAYGVRGEVDFEYAAVVGLPAAFGALAGARLQQRLPARTLALGFAVVLGAVAVALLI